MYNHNPHITGIISKILTLKRQDGGPISIADTLRDDVDSPLQGKNFTAAFTKHPVDVGPDEMSFIYIYSIK